jgi:hypothetical protein
MLQFAVRVLIMPYGPLSPAPELVLREARDREAKRARGSVDDLDQLRDDSTSTGHGGWLVVLVALLGIAGLLILLYFVAGML